MSVLTAIRERFTTKVREEREADTTSYRELVRKIADGEDPDFELVERLLSKTRRIPTPVCPSVASHTAIKVRRTSGTIKYCTCNDCGAEWQHEFDPDQASPEPGRKTIEDLEEDVVLLKQRRNWKEQLDRLPEIEQQRADLTKKLEESQEGFNKAFETHRGLSEKCQQELVILETERLQTENARISLVKTCLDDALVASFKEITERRKTMCHRIEYLSQFNENKTKIDEFKRLTAELPDLEKELAELQKQKLVP